MPTSTGVSNKGKEHAPGVNNKTPEQTKMVSLSDESQKKSNVAYLLS